VAGRATGDIVEKGRDNVEHDILKFLGEIYYKKTFFDVVRHSIETPQQETANRASNVGKVRKRVWSMLIKSPYSQCPALHHAYWLFQPK